MSSTGFEPRLHRQQRGVRPQCPEQRERGDVAVEAVDHRCAAQQVEVHHGAGRGGVPWDVRYVRHDARGEIDVAERTEELDGARAKHDIISCQEDAELLTGDSWGCGGRAIKATMWDDNTQTRTC